MEMNVQQLIEKGNELTDQVVTVNGIIFTHWNNDRDEDAGIFDDYYLAFDRDSWEDKTNCAFLRHDCLEDKLRRRGVRGKAGGINGGGLSNPCRVTGTVQSSEVGPFPFELTNLQSITVWLDDDNCTNRTVKLELI